MNRQERVAINDIVEGYLKNAVITQNWKRVVIAMQKLKAICGYEAESVMNEVSEHY